MDGGAAALLEAWERGLGRSVVERALVLLDPDADRLPIGERNARLLDLYARTFGPVLDALVDCPACGETLDVAVPVEELRAADGDDPGDAPGIEVRLPDTTDLLAVARCHDVPAARAELARRCLVPPPEASPCSDVVDAVAAAVAARDPLASMELAVACPACGNGWEAPLDPSAFVWTALAAEAARLLRQVDALARAYGWREEDVLALSPARRRAYLELAL